MFMRVAKLSLVLFILLSFSKNSIAANRFWVAILPGNWNNTLNWSTTSGGVGGATLPGAADIAIFDGGLGLNQGNCTINTAVAVAGITVSAYTGTISQGANTIVVSGAASFGGGTFTGGSANITISGVFTLSGTAFTSTTAILQLQNNAAFTSGSFIHNSGTVRFNTSIAASTISGISPSFYTLEFVGINRNYDVTSIPDITVVNNLIISGGGFNNLVGGTIDVQGDINVTNTATGCGGTTIVNINGAGTQNFNGNITAGTGALPALTINKASGTLNLTNFPGVSNNFTYTAGTVSAGVSTFCFTHGSVGAYSITGSLSLAGIAFVMNNSLSTLTISAATTLTATGDLTISGAGGVVINTGNINVNGNILLTNTANNGGGTTTINIVGAGNENMDGSTLIVNESRLPMIDINKTGGTLSLLGNISFSNNVTYTAGTINAGASTCYIVNNLTMTGSFSLFNLTILAGGNTTVTVASGSTVTATNTLDLENGANFIMINTGTIAVQGNIIDNNTNLAGGGTGTILINGAGAQSIAAPGVIDEGRFPAVTISKTGGTLSFPSLITVVGNWTYTAGTLDVTTNNSTVVFENTLTITGSHTLNNITFDGSNNFTFTTAVGTTLTVSGTMNMIGTGNITLATGTINLNGNLALANTGGGGGTSVIAFVSGVNQSITSSLPVNENCLPSILINKSGGTLLFPALITVKGNWTYTAGTLDVTTNNSTVVFASPLGSGAFSITGSHTLNNVTFEGNNNNTASIATGTILTVTGTLSTTGAFNVFINTPVAGTTAIQAEGNISINNTSVSGGGDAVIIINGAGAQLFSGNSPASEGLMPFITIQKTTGVLTMSGIISESRDWTYTSGTVDATSNASTVVFGGNSLNISSTGMNFYNVRFTTNSSTLTNNFSVNNNLTIGGLSVLAPGTHTINLGGNWTNWGTLGFNEATSTVNFNGSSLQTVTVPGGENFTNLTVNNSGTGVQLENAVAVATTMTMTQGNIDLNSNTLTLGTSAVLPGTLNYTLGTMINTGSFTRWFAKSTIAAGAVAGLFPVGTVTDYRPFNVSVPLAPTTGGTISVSYTDATTNTNTSFADGTDIIMVRKDLNWALTTATLAGGSYNLGISGTDYGLIGNVSDLRLTLVNSVVGLPGVNGGTILNPQVNRTGLTEANLNNTFFLGSINSTSSPLPITLVSFTAVPENHEVKLNWETTAEVNNNYFTIQRSEDAVHWQDLQQIPGSGNTNTDSKYSATDLSPYPGLSYYRLQQTDFDGRSSFSMIRPVDFNATSSLTVYPNPTTSYINITGISKLLVSVYNSNGQIVSVPIRINGNTVLLDLSAVSAGIYYVHILQAGSLTTRIVVKE